MLVNVLSSTPYQLALGYLLELIYHRLTGLQCLYDLLLGLHSTWYHPEEQILSIGCCCHRRVPLPLFVLVRIGVIKYTPYNQTGEVVHQTRRLHLEAHNALLTCKGVPNTGVLHK